MPWKPPGPKPSPRSWRWIECGVSVRGGGGVGACAPAAWNASAATSKAAVKYAAIARRCLCCQALKASAR